MSSRVFFSDLRPGSRELPLGALGGLLGPPLLLRLVPLLLGPVSLTFIRSFVVLSPKIFPAQGRPPLRIHLASPRMTRVAVVDIGTNSTRLLVADVSPSGAVSTLVRRSTVTRLGAGVDASGSLSTEAIDRVFRTLEAYSEEIDSHDCSANLAVLTSAVRDAGNGAEFAERIRREYSLDARVIAGEEEAQLTFLGAMHDRARTSEPTVVIDIGGGSTEFIVGHDSSPDSTSRCLPASCA